MKMKRKFPLNDRLTRAYRGGKFSYFLHIGFLLQRLVNQLLFQECNGLHLRLDFKKMFLSQFRETGALRCIKRKLAGKGELVVIGAALRVVAALVPQRGYQCEIKHDD